MGSEAPTPAMSGDAATPAPRRADQPAGCPLCDGTGGEVVWRGDGLRVVLPDEPSWPGLTRVIADAHVAEMTDLPPAARAAIMAVVLRVEAAMRAALAPDKVNLASLGNQVPHLHWHVIPRWRDDATFPAAIWAPAGPQREPGAAARRRLVAVRLPAYRAALAAALTGGGPA